MGGRCVGVSVFVVGEGCGVSVCVGGSVCWWVCVLVFRCVLVGLCVGVSALWFLVCAGGSVFCLCALLIPTSDVVSLSVLFVSWLARSSFFSSVTSVLLRNLPSL